MCATHVSLKWSEETLENLLKIQEASNEELAMDLTSKQIISRVDLAWEYDESED